LLAGLGWLIDFKGWRAGCGFLATPGRNPLALYMLAEVLMALEWSFRLDDKALFMVIFDKIFLGRATGRLGSFAFGPAMVRLC
jgi:predicted acyltransferase